MKYIITIVLFIIAFILTINTFSSTQPVYTENPYMEGARMVLGEDTTYVLKPKVSGYKELRITCQKVQRVFKHNLDGTDTYDNLFAFIGYNNVYYVVSSDDYEW